jgi:hypothetical protein
VTLVEVTQGKLEKHAVLKIDKICISITQNIFCERYQFLINVSAV